MTQLSEDVATIFCMEPDVADLTESERQALHAMKFEMLASLHRLYMVIHPDIAEPIVKRKIQGILFGDGEGKK